MCFCSLYSSTLIVQCHATHSLTDFKEVQSYYFNNSYSFTKKCIVLEVRSLVKQTASNLLENAGQEFTYILVKNMNCISWQS